MRDKLAELDLAVVIRVAVHERVARRVLEYAVTLIAFERRLIGRRRSQNRPPGRFIEPTHGGLRVAEIDPAGPTRNKCSAFAGVKQDKTSPRLDTVGEPVLQLLLADGAFGERAAWFGVIVLRDQMKSAILGLPMRRNEKDEHVARMHPGTHLGDLLFQLRGGSVFVKQ